MDKAGNPNTTPSNTLTFKRDTVGPYETISIAAPLFASARTLGRNGAWNVTILISKQPRFFFAEYVSAINAVLTGFQSEPQVRKSYPLLNPMMLTHYGCVSS